MNDPLIRLGEKSDAQRICDFNVAMALETENTKLDPLVTLAGVKGLFDRPEHGFYVVAEMHGDVVASLMVTTEWSDWRNAFFWWIQSVYVAPDFRRQGLYSAMYRFVKDRAKSHPDVCGFRLYVEWDNATAQKTYESLGMIEMHYKMYEEKKQG